jgi:nucleoside-diphosphate-sugar epimerase
MTRGTIAITGAGGFIGGELVRAFRRAGWTVRAGVRDPRRWSHEDPAVEAYQCELPRRIDRAFLAGADVVLHAAYTTRLRTLEEARRVNMGGTIRLVSMARAAGAGRLVFVSSCSAHSRALSFYGRSKYALEKRFDPQRDLVVRPGLVVGHGGVFARMVETVARTPVIPSFRGGRQPVQTIAIEDLCAAMVRLVESGARGRHVLAEEEPISLRKLQKLIARGLGVRARFVWLPYWPAVLATEFCEEIGVPLPLTSENLRGLQGLVAQRATPVPGVRIRPARKTIPALLARGRG